MPARDRDACVIDTHVWLWAGTDDDRRLGRAARRLLAHATRVHVPAICQWEVAVLVDAGRVQVDRPAAEWLAHGGTTPPFVIAELSADIAAVAVELEHEGFHGDPADRLIYATARVLDLPLITGDERIQSFDARQPRTRGRRVIWN